jgi:hypothetical protein
VSEYTRLPTGEYDILLLATPETSSASQVVAKTVANFRGGGVFSVVAADEPNRVTALVLEDNINPLFDQALVRFVHAAPTRPLCNGKGSGDEC